MVKQTGHRKQKNICTNKQKSKPEYRKKNEEWNTRNGELIRLKKVPE